MKASIIISQLGITGSFWQKHTEAHSFWFITDYQRGATEHVCGAHSDFVIRVTPDGHEFCPTLRHQGNA